MKHLVPSLLLIRNKEESCFLHSKKAHWLFVTNYKVKDNQAALLIINFCCLATISGWIVTQLKKKRSVWLGFKSCLK
jgi:hypothetical protein